MKASKLKNLRIFNAIAVGIPIVLALIGIFDEGFLLTALLSTMLTGLIQIIIGIIYWECNKKEISILIYFLGVFLFFFLFYLGSIFPNSIIFLLPAILCLYLTYIIHFKKNYA